MRFIYFLFFISVINASGQSIIIGSHEDELLRSLQLTGKIGLKYSFSSRPYSFANMVCQNDSMATLLNAIYSNRPEKIRGRVKVSVQPFIWENQYNGHHPYGWNDGSMIPAKGYQTKITGGVFAESGILSLQFQPEFVYAVNSQYEHALNYGSSVIENYKHIFPGQSAVRVNFKKISFGISSENLWWGPSINNALLISNNAPGFFHFTFNSNGPFKTKIGEFEWQLIAANIENDSSLLLQSNNYVFQQGRISPFSRYLSGATLSYSPKWVPGFFLGVNRIFQSYKNDLPNSSGFIDSYFPIFTSIFKKSLTNEQSEDAKKRDQIISIFSRFVFPKSHSELYFEYGWNDHSYNLRDFVMTPTHSSAFTVGIKKIIPQTFKSYYDFNLEYTNLDKPVDNMVRIAGNWYTHYQILEGYTHFSQILGAGIGSGNNSFTTSLSHIYNNFDKVGLRFDVIQNDPTEPTLAYKWTDYSATLLFRKKIQFLSIDARLQFLCSQNYIWVNKNRNSINFGVTFRANFQ